MPKRIQLSHNKDPSTFCGELPQNNFVRVKTALGQFYSIVCRHFGIREEREISDKNSQIISSCFSRLILRGDSLSKFDANWVSDD